MKLARVNSLLLVAILLINGYIIILPVIPKVAFWLQSNNKQHIRQLEKNVTVPVAANQVRPTENRLIAPSMVFDQQIFEGKSMATLKKGLWRRPNTSTPDKGSNTVIVGHRLTYSNPRGTLYNLDKVHVGDDLAVWWNGKRYHYSVTKTKIVTPDQISVENPTDNPQLTIYTCTPLWLPKDRLVVIATLKDVQ
ncbi:MAG TPA: class E sortase [Candidatus Saccharimonadales bacterium]|nr:class E sortase [Candidatus Saccharimonadales bacterium]